jgi:hypothetical protein
VWLVGGVGDFCPSLVAASLPAIPTAPCSRQQLEELRQAVVENVVLAVNQCTPLEKNGCIVELHVEGGQFEVNSDSFRGRWLAVRNGQYVKAPKALEQSRVPSGLVKFFPGVLIEQLLHCNYIRGGSNKSRNDMKEPLPFNVPFQILCRLFIPRAHIALLNVSHVWCQ